MSAPDIDAPTTLTIESSAFANNAAVPAKHTADGADVSPALTWSGIPDAARGLALVMDDPDAPRAEPWVHWVIYGLSPDLTGLPEGVETAETLTSPPGAVQGRNSWGTIGYRGPAPPAGHGTHHYHFKLYALDASLDAGPGLTKEALLDAISDSVLAQGELVGTYER